MPTVIIVPGAQTKSPKFLKFISDPFYKHYGVDTQEDHWTQNFKHFLEQSSKFKVEIFNWDGGISYKNLNLASQKLAKFIDQVDPSDEIILFTKSLGGNIADLSLFKTSRKIKKIIYVAVPHQNLLKDHHPKTPLINIYSNFDNYIDLAIKFLYWGDGTKSIKQAENIVFNHLRHSDFNKNIEVWYKGKQIKLFDFYLKVIT